MCSNVKNCWALVGFFPDPQDLLGKNCIIFTKREKVNLTAAQIYIYIYRLPPKKHKLFKWTIVPFISLGLVKQDSVTAKSVVTKQKAEHSGSHQGHTYHNHRWVGRWSQNMWTAKWFRIPGQNLNKHMHKVVNFPKPATATQLRQHFISIETSR